MDKLLNPDVGLMVWTVVTFVALAWVLGKFAWGPILRALESREERLREEAKAAEGARRGAEGLKEEYERRLSQAEEKTRELIAEAKKEAERLRDDSLRSAQNENQKLAEKTRRDLADEQRRLIRDLRSELGGLALRAAEKVVGGSVDKKVQQRLLEEAIEGFDKDAKDTN